jgi:pyruvate dehydrogenase E1 component alpha subunit
MHVIAPEKGMMGAAPIVAGTISLAMGAALASKIRKERRVSVSFFGDGATGEGVLYEALNFAALKRLPILFVCENNFYSTHLPISECRPNNEIFKIGIPLGISSSQVDGNKVLEVYKAARKAVDLCRNGDGPVLIEFITYRLRGHVGADDNIQGSHTDIRPEEEIEKWRKKDPILNLENILLKNQLLKQGETEEIRRQIEKEAEEAHLYATNHSAYPIESELTNYVFKP